MDIPAVVDMEQSIRDKTQGARSMNSERSEYVLPGYSRRGSRRRNISEFDSEALAEALAQGFSSPRTLRLDRQYRRLLAVADISACLVALIICIPVLGEGNDRVRGAVLAGLPLVLLMSKVLGLYDRDELVLRKSTLEEAPKLFQLATLFSLVLWIASGPLKLGDLGGDQIAVMWGLLFAALLGFRVVARSLARRTSPPERCLLLGDPEACARARTKIDQSGRVKAELVAEITSVRIGEEEAPLATVAQMAVEYDIQRVIIAPRSTDHGDVLNLVRAVKSLGLNVSVLPRLLEIVGSSVVVDDVDGLRVLGVRRFGLTRSSLVIKRVFDMVGSGLGLVLLAPLLAVIAVVVKLDSRGPVFFRQPRIGRDDEVFGVLKFRSMVEDAEAQKDDLRDLNEATGLFKIADDPRITRIGRFLRRSSLDELPQLINVFKGEMSLVGPRPLIGEDDSQILGWDRHRLHLTPGMTGPWQVLGSSRIPLEEMVKLDYLYVATWSLWGDIKILLRTVAYVLGRQGL
jgi:exopolysaccharide biosynthesis polyprenyl glycosylphosphotransferase